MRFSANSCSIQWALVSNLGSTEGAKRLVNLMGWSVRALPGIPALLHVAAPVYEQVWQRWARLPRQRYKWHGPFRVQAVFRKVAK
jgi:hypothetical protein